MNSSLIEQISALSRDMYSGYSNLIPYFKMAGLTVLVIVVTVIFFIALRKTRMKNLPYAVQQIILGVAFGLFSILATESSMPISDLNINVNVRDAGPIIAGFIFGPPAGVIAGTIGAVERYMSVLWGGGEYTRIACSAATFAAGIFSGLLRQFIFQKRRPSPVIALSTGFVIEVFHMFMVIMTHLNDTDNALTAVKICFFPMTVFVSLSCMFSIIVVNLISTGLRHGKAVKKTINQRFQVALLIVITVSFFLSTFFVFIVQTGNANRNAKVLLATNINDVEQDMRLYSDDALLKTTDSIAYDLKDIKDSFGGIESEESKKYLIDGEYLSYLCLKYDVAEIDVVVENKILYSNDLTNIGYNMADTTRSNEFSYLSAEEGTYVQDMGLSGIGGYDPSKYRKFAGIHLEDDMYLVVGYNYTQFNESLKTAIEELTLNRHIGETGFVLITDKNWKIISDNSTADNDYYSKTNNVMDMSTALGFNAKNAEPDVMYDANLFGRDSFCMITQSEGFKIIGVITKEEVYSNRSNSLYTNTMAEVLIYTVLFILVISLINILIIKRIDNINAGLKQISDGNLDTVIEENNTKEFMALSTEINTTVDTLKKYISDAEKRYDAELELAKNIQTSALPSLFPAYPNISDFDIYATMHTAKEIGGDFYDFYLLGETRLCFLIADVSGKGIPAAMFMMQSKTMIKNYIMMGIGMGEAVSLANTELCKRNDAGMFVTAFICILDIKTGSLKFVNAGHNPPLIYRKNGEYEYLKSKPGFVLAGLETVKYKIQKTYLEPGDKIYLYTDGVTEAINLNEEMYGEERLKNVLNTIKDKNPKETLETIKEDMDSFTGSAEQFDDITMLMVKFNGETNENIIKKEKEFPADNEYLDNAIDFIDTELENLNSSMKFISQLNIVVEEIFVNIANYAYKNKADASKTATIIFEYDKIQNELTLTITDEGVHFNPLEKDDPDTTLSAEERQIGGLGIFLVKKIMDEVKYEYVNGQNVLILKKKNPKE